MRGWHWPCCCFFIWGLGLGPTSRVPGLLLALGVKRQKGLYLIALATFTGLLGFTVSSKLGYAAAVLACAAAVPEAFFALTAASNSFPNAFLCSAGVCVPPSWSESSGGEDLFPVLDGFV